MGRYLQVPKAKHERMENVRTKHLLTGKIKSTTDYVHYCKPLPFANGHQISFLTFYILFCLCKSKYLCFIQR